jgi:hypothetical protein
MTAVIKLDGNRLVSSCRTCRRSCSRSKRGDAAQSSPFSFFSSFNTIVPCAKLALRSISGTFLCTRF